MSKEILDLRKKNLEQLDAELATVESLNLI